MSSSLPSQAALPVARSTPASARRNCTCPLPSAPAIPRISPFATSRSIGPNRSPCRPETARSTSRCASWSCRSGNASWSGRPIISATRLSSDMRGGLERPLADAVAKDRDPVGDAEHLRQPMADVDDADSCAALLEHQRVQPLDILRPERGRRLVEEQHLRPGEQALTTSRSCRSASDSDPAAPSPGRRARTPRASPPPTPPCVPYAGCSRRERRGRGSRPPTDRGRASRSDTRCRGRACGPRRESRAGGAAPDLDGSLVRRDEAARDPEQCRFPGPVLPDERVDLAGAAVDADVAERLYGSERLRHAA